jgi:hypothetical protein
MRKMNLTIIAATAALGAMLIAPQARADLIFQLGTAFNGAAPSGSGPWLTADFKTVGSGGAVTLTLTANLQDPKEFISNFAFNIRPVSSGGYLPSAVTVSSPAGTSVAHTTDNGQKNVPGFGGWKQWDFVVSFPTSAANRFANGTAVITLTAPGLTADYFSYLNEKNPTDQSPLYVGAHIQGIAIPGSQGTTSGAIGSPVPEASTMVAGAGALVLLVLGAGLNSRRLGVIRIGKNKS